MRERAIAECQKMLANKADYLLMDTESTGIFVGDEIIELSLVDLDGNVIYNGLFNPDASITDEAYFMHKISESDLYDCPRFSEEWPGIMDLIAGKTLLAYNSRSDMKMLHQTLKKQRLKTPKMDSQCVQDLYDKFQKLNRSVKLEAACAQMGLVFEQTHRATGDCLMTLELIKAVAASR